MAQNTKVAEGLHLVKLRASGDASYTVSIPKDLAAEAEMYPGAGFVAVRRIGPCVILSIARYAIPEDAQNEADRKFLRAIEAWEKNGKNAEAKR